MGDRRLTERRRRILIIDDDEDTCTIITQILSYLGFDPTCITDPVAAVAMILHDRFDALLVDLVMPGYSGFDILQVARSSPYNADVPVAAVTSHLDYRHRVIESGFSDFMVKPLDLSRIRMLMERFFPVS